MPPLFAAAADDAAITMLPPPLHDADYFK